MRRTMYKKEHVLEYIYGHKGTCIDLTCRLCPFSEKPEIKTERSCKLINKKDNNWYLKNRYSTKKKKNTVDLLKIIRLKKILSS